MMPLFERQRPMQSAMSELLGKRVVCVVKVFCCFVSKLQYVGGYRIQQWMSMTVVVREAFCVHAGGAWAL